MLFDPVLDRNRSIIHTGYYPQYTHRPQAAHMNDSPIAKVAL